MADIVLPDAHMSNPQPPLTPSEAALAAPDESLPSPPGTPVPKLHFSLPSDLYRYVSATDQSLLRLRR